MISLGVLKDISLTKCYPVCMQHYDQTGSLVWSCDQNDRRKAGEKILIGIFPGGEKKMPHESVAIRC